MLDDLPIRSPGLIALAIAPLLLLAACKESDPEQSGNVGDKDSEQSGAIAPNQSVTPPGNVESLPREIQIEELSDGWRVEDIFEPETRARGGNSPPPEGAIAEIYPESLNWSFRPRGGEAMDDFCEEPVSGVIASDAAAAEIRNEFAPAMRKFAIDPKSAGRPHEFLCSGGSWGASEAEGADFIPVGADRILLRWTGGNIILLERLGRVTEKKDLTPQDYLADENPGRVVE